MGSGTQYEPKSPLARWTEERLPVVGFVKSNLLDFPTPRNLNYFYTFGGILAVMLVSQILTGIVLVMHYTPNVSMAFSSVELFTRDGNFGWLLRPMHAVGASMFFIAVYIHIFRGMYYGSYKNPREVLWMIGVLILVVMMATAFMGYVLPWGQMSLWGAKVITNLFSAIPFVGETIVTLLWGGFSVDNPTLNRFFALHYLLPFVLVGLVVLHIWALHVTGNSNPTGVSVKSDQDTIPFHPYYTIKDAFAVVVFFVVFAFFVFFAPDYMGHPVNYVPGNPVVTPSHIVPEWYFLPFYAILRAVPSTIGGVLAMGASIGVFFLLPWLDTSRVRSGTYRPMFRWAFWIFALVCVGLGFLGAMPVTDDTTLISRILTIYYFAHFFVILPLLGLIETPRALPPSISDAVLQKNQHKTGAA